MQNQVLREHLVKLLKGGQAFCTLDQALEGLKPENRNKKVSQAIHSIWEELEHMRIAQEDILRFTLEADWQALDFPKDYWSSDSQSYSDDFWDRTVSGFTSDMNRVIQTVEDKAIDLMSEIPHAKGYTYFREVLVIAEHNAYHTGHIVQIRKLLDNWH